MITVAPVYYGEWKEAHSWHEKNADMSDHLLPRNDDDFEGICRDGHAWWAKAGDGEPCALIYYVFEKDTIEIGGLFVKENYRKSGLGLFLAVLIMGYAITFEGARIDVSFCVHTGNEPVILVAENCLKFERNGTLELDATQHPNMAANEVGRIEGIRFLAAWPESYEAIAEFLMNWSGVLSDGTAVEVNLAGDRTEKQIVEDLRYLVTNL